MCGTGCRLSVCNGCWLCGNWLLFRQRNKQCLDFALLVWNGEAGLCHKANSFIAPADCKVGALVTVHSHKANHRHSTVFNDLAAASESNIPAGYFVVRIAARCVAAMQTQPARTCICLFFSLDTRVVYHLHRWRNSSAARQSNFLKRLPLMRPRQT